MMMPVTAWSRRRLSLRMASSFFILILKKYIPKVIKSIGETKTKLYKINKEVVLAGSVFSANFVKIERYGPLAQGTKNKLTTKPTPKALQGPVALRMISCIFGRQERGTSIMKNLPYQKTSLKLASAIKMAKMPAPKERYLPTLKIEITLYAPKPINR